MKVGKNAKILREGVVSEKLKVKSEVSDKPDVVRVRFAEKNGRWWYYAVNTDNAPANVSFDVKGAAVDTLDGNVRSRRISLSLEPYELRSFVSAAPEGAK